MIARMGLQNYVQLQTKRRRSSELVIPAKGDPAL